jgi:uncharacterized protein YkwD
VALAALLAGCDSGSGGAAVPAPSGVPTPQATATASTTPAADVAGTAVDDTSGQPIVGASVSVGGATATTGADGSFDVKNVPASSAAVSFAYLGAGYPVYANAQWVEIAANDGHAVFHAIRSIAPSGTTNLGNVAIAQPSATDIAWLAQINSDRATRGVPAVNSPLAFESVTLQTARYWAGEMASLGFFAHTCPSATPSCTEFWLYETQRGGLPSAQNIDLQPANGSWQAAEGAFMAETANCPGANWQTCPFAETTGHYINIMEAANWAGVGSSGPYFVENFGSPADANALYSGHVPQYSHALQLRTAGH